MRNIADSKCSNKQKGMAMPTYIEFKLEDLGGSVLPSQYNDLTGRRVSAVEGERRLLWAVLEDAVRTYLTSRACSNPIQRRKFNEVRTWFESGQDGRAGLFGFRTICDLLDIDPGRLLKGLRSKGARVVPVRVQRPVRSARVRNLAA
jgi:hypothetical protein